MYIIQSEKCLLTARKKTKLEKETRLSLTGIFMAVLSILLILRAPAKERNYHQNLPGEGSLVLISLSSEEKLVLGSLSAKERYLQTLSGQGRLILVIFDFESLSCPVCLDSFKNFCEALQSKGQENSAIGILTYRNPEREKTLDNYTKIIEKKLRGFIIGNNIKFPILLDKFHIFEGMNLKEAAIFLFDFSKGMLKKYTLPLTKKQLEEIFNGQKKD